MNLNSLRFAVILVVISVLGLLYVTVKAHAETVESKITRVATEIGVSPTLAKAIAQCESGLKQGVKNKGSSASGVFQFLNSTWNDTLKRMNLPPTLDVFDAGSNILAGIWLLKTDGVRHWLESKPCWSKVYTV